MNDIGRKTNEELSPEQQALIGALQEVFDEMKANELDIFNSIAEEVKKQFRLNIESTHGISHWQRVNEIGFYIAARSDADCRVTTLFSILHDSQRTNEYHDPEHGPRASEYAKVLFNRGILPMTQIQLDKLVYALKHHSERHARSEDITVQSCWDSDRLDLYRIGEIPDSRYLYTEVAKRKETRDFALKLYQIV